MRKALLIVGAILVLTPTSAFSAGIEVAWNACYGQPGAADVMRPMCDTDAGSQTLVVSFRPPPGVTQLEGLEIFVDYQLTDSSPWACPLSPHDTPSIALPCWWNFAIGQIRASQLTTLHVSPTDANGDPIILCDNHYFLDNGALGGGGMVNTSFGQGQLRSVAAIYAGTGLPVAADAQQYGVAFRISNGSTLPAGTCGGCTASVCFMASTIKLTSYGVPNVVLQAPHPGSVNWLPWRPDTTPALHHTWGQIKGIYR